MGIWLSWVKTLDSHVEDTGFVFCSDLIHTFLWLCKGLLQLIVSSVENTKLPF
jgi:hypothetical protein